ncbi:MAG TPA: hypothetical protein DCS07_02865, partial [Bdellovibrionales bacterium]|nr:hypothetical protein [Bdellovibrionales bacterium]
GAEGEVLNGKEGARYIRFPAIVTLAMLPIMGLTFYVAFPLIVIGFVLLTFAKIASRAVNEVFSRNAHLTTMRWNPMTAYMKNPDSTKKEKDGTSEIPTGSVHQEKQTNREKLS